MRKFCAAFVVVVLSALFGASSAHAQQGYYRSYSSNGWSGHSTYSGPVQSGSWEYVPSGRDANGYRTEAKVVFRPDPYSSGGHYRSHESWSKYGYSRTYTRTDSSGTYTRREYSGRNSSHYSERFTPRR